MESNEDNVINEFRHLSPEAIRGAIQADCARGMGYRKIARKFNIHHSTVIKWCKRDYIFNKKRNRKSKFDKTIKEKIIKLAENKTTGMDGRSGYNIAKIITSELLNENNTNAKSISKSTVNKILLEELGKTRKITKSFHLNANQMMERKKFAEYIIENQLSGKDFIFTDEKRFYLNKPYNKQSNKIRLSKLMKFKLKKGCKEAINLVTYKESQYEPSIMVSGGITSEGVSSLIFCIGTMDSSAYIQAMKIYKQDLKYRLINSYIFQDDNAPCHVSKQAKEFKEKEFKKDRILSKWPSRSPDLSPIELLWNILQDKLALKKSKTIEELKTNLVYIWNRIPPELCKNLISQFDVRIRQIIKTDGQPYRKTSEVRRKYIRVKGDRIRTKTEYNFDKCWQVHDRVERIVYNSQLLKSFKSNVEKKMKNKITLNKKFIIKESSNKSENPEEEIKIAKENLQIWKLNQKFIESNEKLHKDLELIENMSLDDFFDSISRNDKQYFIGRSKLTNSKKSSNLVTESSTRVGESDDEVFDDDGLINSKYFYAK